ncbi:hypothetical protein RKD56_004411 [Priestia megaterium]|jgi:uncharacterized protein
MEYINQITNAAVNGESKGIKALLNKEPSLFT